MKERVKSLYMDMAHRAAQMSRAKRLQVGCLIVKDDNIISFSWNGTPAGWNNDCEDIVTPTLPYLYGDGPTLITKPEVIHAEANAISKLAKNSASGLGASMFITHAPCMECAKLIYGAGIDSVFYRNQYRNNAGIEFLKKCNVTVEQYGEQEQKDTECTTNITNASNVVPLIK